MMLEALKQAGTTCEVLHDTHSSYVFLNVDKSQYNSAFLLMFKHTDTLILLCTLILLRLAILALSNNDIV